MVINSQNLEAALDGLRGNPNDGEDYGERRIAVAAAELGVNLREAEELVAGLPIGMLLPPQMVVTILLIGARLERDNPNNSVDPEENLRLVNGELEG